MTLPAIQIVNGTAVCVRGDDIDTDQIIPARFLRCITFDGLGTHLFEDARKAAKTAGQVHPLDDSRFQNSTIMFSGRNFGCGSSREHAPQSLHRAGFRAMVAESFAEIFFGNATALGIPCLSVSAADVRTMFEAVAANPKMLVTLDVEKLEVRFGNKKASGFMPDQARRALLDGTWDALEMLLAGMDDVRRAARHLS